MAANFKMPPPAVTVIDYRMKKNEVKFAKMSSTHGSLMASNQNQMRE